MHRFVFFLNYTPANDHFFQISALIADFFDVKIDN